MSISFSGMSPGTNLKTNFINDYGEYALDFKTIDPLGKQKMNTLWPYIVMVVSIILTVYLFIVGKKEKDPNTNQPIEKTTLKKILTGLAWSTLLISLISGGYGVYLYFFIYLPEYLEWSTSLPPGAFAKLTMIKAIDSVESQARSNRNLMPQNKISFGL